MKELAMEILTNETMTADVGGRSHLVRLGAFGSKQFDQIVPALVSDIKGWQWGLILLLLAIVYDQGKC